MTLIIFTIAIAVISYAIIIVTYVSYFLLVLRNRKVPSYFKLIQQIEATPLKREDLPKVTILVPAYNEEKVISEKLQNLSELDYPFDKVDVLIVDDCSTDRTCEIAKNMFSKLDMRGKIIKNPQRVGANASCNIGVVNANSSLILRTDADTVIKADSLLKAVRIILNLDNVGGVTGAMVPVVTSATVATTMENSYRTLFSKMSTAESALHSTYASGGGFALIRKKAFSPIPVGFGSTDANISLSFVRKGFRYLYVPDTYSFEAISKKLGEQGRQKVRRASRLIQSTILNMDFFFNRKYGTFGMAVFPLRFMMFLVCPFLTAVAIFATFCCLFSLSEGLSVGILVVAGIVLYLRKPLNSAKLNSIISLLFQQFCLVAGLLFASRKITVWQRVLSE